MRGEGCAAASRLGTKRVAGEEDVGAHTRSVEVISELQPCIQRGSARRFDLGARSGAVVSRRGLARRRHRPVRELMTLVNRNKSDTDDVLMAIVHALKWGSGVRGLVIS